MYIETPSQNSTLTPAVIPWLLSSTCYRQLPRRSMHRLLHFLAAMPEEHGCFGYQDEVHQCERPTSMILALSEAGAQTSSAFPCLRVPYSFQPYYSEQANSPKGTPVSTSECPPYSRMSLCFLINCTYISSFPTRRKVIPHLFLFLAIWAKHLRNTAVAHYGSRRGIVSRVCYSWPGSHG